MDSAVVSRGSQPPDLSEKSDEPEYPKYNFSFTPFLLSTYRFGISPDRPICKAWSQGHCPLGNSCPDRHVSPSNFSNNLVCKHWLRGLCKKGESCEFLHEYNLRKMPECSFFVRNGYCTNGDDCLYLHIPPEKRVGPCPHYDRGFCLLGDRCAKRHARKKLCRFYLAGFCPDGSDCKEGVHAKWTTDLEPPQIRVERDPEEIAEEQARIREAIDEEKSREREKWGGGRGRWGGGGNRNQDGRRGRGGRGGGGHY